VSGDPLSAGHVPAPRLDRTGYELVFDERFDDPELSSERWLAHYLPHWTTAERSRARYDLTADGLRLRIDADQPAWRVEDGSMRVSNIQTGVFAGALGSMRGQHRHRPDLTVRSGWPTLRLYTPRYGLVEVEMRASADPTTMLAFWLVGFEEDSPEDAGEICVAELFGNAIGREESRINMGIKAHSDPRLTDEMAEVTLGLDATQLHTYSTEWTPNEVRFYVDGVLVREIEQRIDYPLQVMVDLFEFPTGETRDPADYPKTATIGSVRGYRPVRST
jgi:hypothetical protein